MLSCLPYQSQGPCGEDTQCHQVHCGPSPRQPLGHSATWDWRIHRLGPPQPPCCRNLSGAQYLWPPLRSLQVMSYCGLPRTLHLLSRSPAFEAPAQAWEAWLELLLYLPLNELQWVGCGSGWGPCCVLSPHLILSDLGLECPPHVMDLCGHLSPPSLAALPYLPPCSPEMLFPPGTSPWPPSLPSLSSP